MGLLLRIANGRCLPPLSVIWGSRAMESSLLRFNVLCSLLQSREKEKVMNDSLVVHYLPSLYRTWHVLTLGWMYKNGKKIGREGKKIYNLPKSLFGKDQVRQDSCRGLWIDWHGVRSQGITNMWTVFEAKQTKQYIPTIWRENTKEDWVKFETLWKLGKENRAFLCWLLQEW